MIESILRDLRHGAAAQNLRDHNGLRASGISRDRRRRAGDRIGKLLFGRILFPHAVEIDFCGAVRRNLAAQRHGLARAVRFRVIAYKRITVPQKIPVFHTGIGIFIENKRKSLRFRHAPAQLSAVGMINERHACIEIHGHVIGSVERIGRILRCGRNRSRRRRIGKRVSDRPSVEDKIVFHFRRKRHGLSRADPPLHIIFHVTGSGIINERHIIPDLDAFAVGDIDGIGDLRLPARSARTARLRLSGCRILAGGGVFRLICRRIFSRCSIRRISGRCFHRLVVFVTRREKRAHRERQYQCDDPFELHDFSPILSLKRRNPAASGSSSIHYSGLPTDNFPGFLRYADL